jgi:hypothetical protein
VCAVALAALWACFLCGKTALRIDGFYHMYAPPAFPRALYKEHFLQITRSEVFKATAATHVVLVGKDLHAAKALLADYEGVHVQAEVLTGDEGASLFALWQHCRSGAGDLVWYMHGKGSYHPSPSQDVWRRTMTRDVLSEGCLQELESGRDVCGMRFSPVPHAHFPGNFWLARCEYIARLPDPRTERGTLCFEENGKEFYRVAPNGPCYAASMLGFGRYRFEHWVGTGKGLFSDCLGMHNLKEKVSPYVAGAPPPMCLGSFAQHCEPAPRPGLMKAALEFLPTHAGFQMINERLDAELMSRQIMPRSASKSGKL